MGRDWGAGGDDTPYVSETVDGEEVQQIKLLDSDSNQNVSDTYPLSVAEEQAAETVSLLREIRDMMFEKFN